MRGPSKSLVFAVGAMALTVTTAANAASVQNGNFSGVTSTVAGGNGEIGSYSNETTTEANWALSSQNNSYFFVFTPSTVSNPGSVGGPLAGNPDFVALDNLVTASPNGGDFVGADPGYPNTGNSNNASLEQTITGLTAGQQYTVSFDYAGAQQKGFTGSQTEGWAVSLGNQTLDTPILNNVQQGFTGWQTDSLTFTATSSSEVLSFLATGTGTQAAPAFALLDGVSISSAPEPASWAMMMLGVGAIGSALRIRRKQVLATA